jgi:hypothetical protein
LEVPDQANEEMAYCLGLLAFLWGFAPWNLARTLQITLANPEAPNCGAAMNRFHHATELASPEPTNALAPSTDTLNVVAWLDLRGGPVTLRIPDMRSRYYSFQFVNAYFDTFGYVSSRSRRSRAKSITINGPGCPDPPMERGEAFASQTPLACVFGRIAVDGSEDLLNVIELQKQIVLVAPGDCGRWPGPPPLHSFQYEGSLAFFEQLGELMSTNPPLPRDQSLVTLFRSVGVGAAFDSGELDGPTRRGLERAASVGPRVLNEEARTAGRKVNGWSLFEPKEEYFGTDYIFRSVASYIGPFLGMFMDPPAEAYFPQAFFDGDGDRLDGSQYNYLLRFEPDLLPPVHEFWSLTIYERATRQLVANPIQRYSISNRTPGIRYAPDGSLSIYIQHLDPGSEKRPNWLPAPRAPMYVTLRMYVPQAHVITGEWVPPPIRKDGAWSEG